MLSLLNSERFQNELKFYNEKIKQVSDPAVKLKLENHLNKLVSHVKHLDTHHQEMILNKQIREMSRDNRDKITESRKALDKLLKDYFRANNIKLPQNL